MIKSKMMKWAGHVACMKKKWNAYRVLGKCQRRKTTRKM
jgi:hypothetical protein